MALSIGAGANNGTVDARLTQVSVSLRDTMRQVYNLYTWITGGGNGLATLQALGYGSVANPANPGSISDAQYALNMINYMGTVMALYYGNATQTSTFNFETELSVLWGGV